MKAKKIIVCLVVLLCLLSILLVKQTVEHNREHWRQGILTLNNAAFFLITVMPELEDPADWNAAATALGQLVQLADVQDKGDNGKVKQLLLAVANSHRTDPTALREALGELTISWNTNPGEGYCIVEKGDLEGIFALCGDS